MELPGPAVPATRHDPQRRVDIPRSPTDFVIDGVSRSWSRFARALAAGAVERRGLSRWRSGKCRVIRNPGMGRFQLGGNANEDVFPAVGGGELDADGEALSIAVQREADRRLPTHVEGRRERGEL